ncbi:MAG: Zn-dependent hydrolase [Gammaproteobacteria bacterium]|nr:Zn-dependent hydrolase [Gammaproteobacteria bacterium]
MAAITIDSQRLWNSLMDLAKIGATAKGGVCRLALTDLDRQARDLFTSWCTAAGCTVAVDGIGNIFARRPGRNDQLPPIIAGSHIDTQPSGGKFDGNFGVLAGLEVVRSLNDHGIQTEAPIEVVVWTNEEGSRFTPVMMGSGVFVDAFTLESTLQRTDLDGVTVGEALTKIGYSGSDPPGNRPVGAYFEAHIEQGPILEDSQKVIGVVGGALGLRWYDVVVTGQDAHAGPTPMRLRKNALVAASKMVADINELAHRFQPDGRATVGFMQVKPNSRNVIPGEVKFSIDLRHAEDDALDKMEAQTRALCERQAQSGSVTVDVERVANYPACKFDVKCVASVRGAARKLGISHMDIVSGAGHDAIYMARVAPTSMIFVPCEGGISHNELENAKAEDLAAGCNVLLNVMLEQAQVAK